ncbi:SRPBCC family protein [Nitratireductor rhodophyticola]|uniref:SRPBCC family protein n=1 Tax=Nitratireductor rhodophyticola TaxID=2854036 RepID=A0ABS7R5J4_9HYPH|nr:SRPBCC family protein [Nitratireductor rhodophyticola]MBY8915682.1 SRPBCC family protein [Nitratireductor rhodophyticola]MBY8919249.1 SRPBCC family protein [Nitratireductor rhodophyticola]WPZ13127.1 SRPBCC family protein [Nitratireductor rhodophyticola]
MSTTIDVAPELENELVLARIIDAPREKIFRAWTDPEILKQWFVPKPWTISKVEMDVRPGGASLIVMRDPDGNEYPNPGIFLEVVENEKIVTTDAFTGAWTPSEKPFMTMILTLEDAGEGRTRYIARALHWNAEDREAHEKMGFHEGWGQCADQLEEIAATL